MAVTRFVAELVQRRAKGTCGSQRVPIASAASSRIARRDLVLNTAGGVREADLDEEGVRRLEDGGELEAVGVAELEVAGDGRVDEELAEDPGDPIGELVGERVGPPGVLGQELRHR